VTRLMAAWMNVAGCRAPRARFRSSGLAVGAVALLGALAPAAAAAAGCPNEEFRLGPSAQLPECRAYEMVSPPDKGGGSVYPVVSPQLSTAGDAIEFFSTSAFANAEGSPLTGSYIARRGGGDWVTETADPPTENSPTELTSSNDFLPAPASSPDLGQTIQVSTRALTPGAIEGGSNLYLHDNLTGGRQLIVAFPTTDIANLMTVPEGEELYVVGGADDWSQILISSVFALTGNGQAGERNLYDFTPADGALRQINYVPAAGGGEEPAPGAEVIRGVPYAHAISADGSRIFFSYPGASTGQGAIYMREGSHTIPISTSRMPGEEGQVKPADLQLADASGTVVYFRSYAALTPDAVLGNGTATIYRYDVETGNLTDIAPGFGPQGPEVTSLAAVSESGSNVFFTASAVLAPGAEPAEYPENTNAYADVGGKLQFIARLNGSGGLGGEVSPNGRFLAFGAAEFGCESNCPTQIYLYDTTTESRICVSCGSAPSRGNAVIGGQEERQVVARGDRAPRAVLDDGTVYFSTPNQLVPADINRVADIYAYREGAVHLISPGDAEDPARFGGASLDGHDVFFTTAERLVGADVDGDIDLYDARVGGGLASQWPPPPPPPCEGESCRTLSPAAPAGLSFGSTLAEGEACAAPIQAAQTAARQARQFARQAHAARRVPALARSLRRKAAAKRRAVKKLRKRADHCRGVGR
jgi:hypothetical protein